MRTIIKRRSVVVITSEVTTTTIHRISEPDEQPVPALGEKDAECERLLLAAGSAEVSADSGGDDFG